MPAKRKLRKVIDREAVIRCASGRGLIREELWEDETGAIARYNLAFVNHFLCTKDNGRVLGYDASHGYHHRHFMGSITSVTFKSYEATLARFIDEVQALRKEKL